MDYSYIVAAMRAAERIKKAIEKKDNPDYQYCYPKKKSYFLSNLLLVAGFFAVMTVVFTLIGKYR